MTTFAQNGDSGHFVTFGHSGDSDDSRLPRLSWTTRALLYPPVPTPCLRAILSLRAVRRVQLSQLRCRARTVSWPKLD